MASDYRVQVEFTVRADQANSAKVERGIRNAWMLTGMRGTFVDGQDWKYSSAANIRVKALRGGDDAE